ncbi:glycosyltransferase [Comamonas antarctica]|uniref:Glycosyltransferase n=1 Tax=Comamonas antarctica TaxID=2743470 RepID=A0A6N1XAK6_9BURK|nr:glycosyltransferase [Comamonas antarctica]QKV54845.1 glycosyltransferase [Comamonas antarctica]
MNLTKAIIEEGTAHEIWILLNNQIPATVKAIRDDLSDLLPQNRIITFESISRTNELNSKDIFRTKSGELCRQAFISALKPDFVLITSLFEGLGDDSVLSVENEGNPHNTAVILYDLIPLVQKDKYLVSDETKNHYMRKLENLCKAEVLLAISEFSRDEGLEVLGLQPERVINISSAIGDEFKPIDISPAEKSAFLSKMNIKKKFLMYIGSFDQRKNHRALIEAFSLLPKEIRSQYELVIAGNGWPAIYKELEDYASSCGLSTGEVNFVGHIADQDLLSLYNLCDLFVFPSLFEGFGLPILEAMSCGKPAIGSNSTSIPEVVGHPDALFDPTSPASIAAKIKEVLTSQELYDLLCSHALKHSKRFSWNKSAIKAIAAMEAKHAQTVSGRSLAIDDSIFDRANLIKKISDIPESKTAPESCLAEISSAIAVNEYLAKAYTAVDNSQEMPFGKEKVGIITTWNTKCGIATYSKYLMRDYPSSYTVLAPYADALTEDDEDFVSRCWEVGEKDNFSKLEQCIEEKNLTAILIQFNYGFFNFNDLSNLIKKLASKDILCFVELHSTIDPPPHILDKKLSDLSGAFKLCAAVLVHSENDVSRLAKIGIAQNVQILQHGVNRPKPLEVKYDKAEDEFVVASYGFFLPHKGLFELIKAFALFSKGDIKKKLLLVNAEYPAPISRELIDEGKRLAAELKIQDQVTFISDFLSDEESLGYLSKSDVVVYPYQETGESASGAIRLGLASKKLVLVTPLNIFRDIDDLVIKAKSTSIEDIAAALTNVENIVKTGDATLKKSIIRRQLWLDSHDYKNLSKQINFLIGSFREINEFYGIKLTFDAIDKSFRSVVGTRIGNTVATDGREGVLLFGPYIGLASNSYNLKITGNCSDTNSADVMDVFLKHTDGSHSIEYISVPRSGSTLKEINFSIDKPIINFEIQIITGGQINIALDKIVISANRRIS